MPPVSGATLPMAMLIAGFAWTWAFLSSPQPETAATGAGPCTKRTRLLYRQDVLREGPRLVVGDGPVGRHGNGAPHPGRALLDLLREISLGVLAGLVFGRHLLVRGANQLFVQGMAAEACLFLQ